MRLNKLLEKSDLTGMMGIILAGTYLIRRISVYFDISSVQNFQWLQFDLTTAIHV